jgi:ribose transport system ATP-binding protein
MPTLSAPLLELRGLTKAFGNSLALDAVDLAIEPGEVHGLLGANGSGKSTLIKVLAGYHDVAAGTLSVRGRAVDLPLGPGVAQELGLAFVHQDLGLVPSLSVLENFLLGSLAASRRHYLLSWRQARRDARETFERYGLDLDPRALVSDIRPVDRALLAIVRAMESPGIAQVASDRLIVLDEPTVFLPQEEVDHLFELVRRITAAGSSVLFVSHDLDEVRHITDRVTVLRNGRVAASGRTSELPTEQLVEAIVGMRLAVGVSERRAAPAATERHLEVHNLSSDALGDISFMASRGEIVGLTGLLGSGYDDVVRALAGAIRSTGELRLGARRVNLRSWDPQRATAAMVVLIPGDRLKEAAVRDLTVTDNVTMPNLGGFVRHGVLSRRAMMTKARSLASTFDVRPRDPQAMFGTLSGGNQQKVVLAKWLQTPPDLLLLQEPTQGVDIGARQQIFDTIRRGAPDRVTLCASSDHDQLAQLCHRVLIMRRGRIARELGGDDVTKARITEECFRSGQGRTIPA